MIINRIISKLRFAAIVCAIAAQVISFNEVKAVLKPQEMALIAILKEFVDINQNKEKKFKEYVTEINKQLELHPEAPKYVTFRSKLKKMADCQEKNPTRFAKEFNEFKTLVPDEFKSELEKLAREKNLKLKHLLEIFKFRLSKI